ncbi:MAG TPA: ABC transporter permease [Terracidiphilus sp.]|nr:ABC transporter permease [Terracidiphilus sp.]
MALMKRIANLFRRERLNEEIEAELRAHIEMRTEENIAAGMTPEAARRDALVRFGNPGAMKERVAARDVNLVLDGVWRDLHYAARQLRRSPAFALTAIATLALGIGANVAVFGVLSAVLLRPLPFPYADRLVRVYSVKGGQQIGPSPLDARDFAAASHTLQYLAAYDQWRKNVVTTRAGDVPQQTKVGLAPAELFEALSVRPLMGRLFLPEENQEGRNREALITARYWKLHYGGRSDILNQSLIVNDIRYRIIGVLPETIPAWVNEAETQIDVWEPFFPTPGFWEESNRPGRGYQAVGLLRPGVTLGQAQAELETLAQGLAAAYPVDRGYGVRVQPLAETRAANMTGVLLLLMGAVGLILLIACSNLAGLLLARNTARRREFAMRAALGAGRGALVRQILTEALLLSGIGAGCGIGVAGAGLAVLRARYAEIPQLVESGLDWRALAFTLLVAVLTTIGFGLAPALLESRVNLCDALKESGRTGGSIRQRFRKALVVGQIALSLVLVIAAGLLTQTIVRLEGQDLGFRVDHLLRAHFYLPPARYATPESITQFCAQFYQRAQALPGVRDVSITTIYPPADLWRMNFSIDGRPVSTAEDIPQARFGVTDEHYLSTLGIALVRGRDFASTDTEGSPAVAIVNQAFVRRFFAGGDPVGHSLLMGTPPGQSVPDEWMANEHERVMVVGVMADAKNSGLEADPEPQFITLYRQAPLVNFGFKDIVVRSSVKPETLGPELRREIEALDATLPLAEVQSMKDLISGQTWDKRFTASVLGGFAALGLLLAVVGMYGVISFLVAQRTQEIGVRMALGATRGSVLWMVVREGLALGIVGVGFGLAGSAMAGRSLSGMLYGVRAFDAATVLASAAALVAIAGAASFIPARRAAGIDPATVLRSE